MDTVSLLREQLQVAHQTMEGTIEGTTQEMADWMPPGKATPLGASYAHAVIAEDMILNGVLRQQPPMYTTSWASRTGASELMPDPGANWASTYAAWNRRVRVDMPAMREYAQAVYTASDQYLATLTSDDVDRVLDLSAAGLGQQTLGSALGTLIIGHMHNIAGEISCLKGLQGAQGYPF